jgi:hypothetical protein
MDISHYYDMKVKPPLMDWQIFYVWYNRSMTTIILLLMVEMVIYSWMISITS